MSGLTRKCIRMSIERLKRGDGIRALCRNIGGESRLFPFPTTSHDNNIFNIKEDLSLQETFVFRLACNSLIIPLSGKA